MPQLASLSLPATFDSLSKLPEFNSLGTSLADVHKTGMGSSAALITSLVAALLVHSAVVDEESLRYGADESIIAGTNFPLKGSVGRDLVHNTAQYVHCLAQGKVGSGFDVSSAVYGSQIYRKFEASAIEHLMADGGVDGEELKRSLMPSSSSWTNSHSSVALPPGVRLVLADVDAGSDTPSLVGKVLAWRKNSPVEGEWR